MSQIPMRRGTTTAGNRQRASQNTVSTATTSRRRKSRSPDSRPASALTMSSRTDTDNTRKKKTKSVFTVWPLPGPSTSTADETAVDRGRKSRVKHKSQTRPENSTPRHRSSQVKVKKERSASRDSTRHSKPVSPAPSGTEDEGDTSRVSHSGYTGPLAAAEFARLKAENETMKKQMHNMKKAISKQGKVIDELRQEVASTTKSKKEQSLQMEKLKSKSNKSEELLSSIEGNLQCQICLDSLMKPFALSPCGHIYCQGCLQNWFRSAPPNDEDMYDDDEPDYLLYRHKSCPSCRSSVRTRPIPLFIVKSIASSIAKAKLPPSQAHRASPPPEADPWLGIFPVLTPDGEDEDMFDDEDEDEDSEDDFDGNGMWELPGYGSGSDDESYEGVYVEPRWAPPTVYVDPDDYYSNGHALEDEDIALLRRGATTSMIELFGMQYSHEHGITAMLDDNTVYLGWNISLHENDITGEMFMEWTGTDVFERPQRWRVRDDLRNETWEAWRLVPENEEDDYDTTDTEAWLNSEDDD